MKKNAACLGLAAAFLLSLPALADVKPQRTRLEGERAESVLWVGNSFFYYNNGIQSMMAALSQAAGNEHRMRNVMAAIGGAGIDWHDIESYLKPGAKLGYYSFYGDNQVRFNPPGRQFDGRTRTSPR